MSDGQPGPKAIYEAYLDTHANPPFITVQLAELVRELLRAVGSDKPHAAVYAAAERIKLLGDLAARSAAPIAWYELMLVAVGAVREGLPDEAEDAALAAAALRGAAWLADASEGDEAAKARAEKRRGAFVEAIGEVEKRRGKECEID